jgi:hypothetical protein
MQSIQITARIGEDGILTIPMPSNWKNTDVEIIVIVQPLEEIVSSSVNCGWPLGFFEEVIGGWEGEPLVRDEPGEYEVREALD